MIKRNFLEKLKRFWRRVNWFNRRMTKIENGTKKFGEALELMKFGVMINYNKAQNSSKRRQNQIDRIKRIMRMK